MTNGEAFKQLFGLDIEDLVCKGPTGIYEWSDSAAFIISDDEKVKRKSRTDEIHEQRNDLYYISSTQNELAIMNNTLARFLDLLEERWKNEDDNEEN